ncbi:MAG: protein kinase [Planctomycetota bacterium]
MLEEQAADGATWDHLIATIKPKEYDEAGTAEFSAATIFGEVQTQPVAIQDVLDMLTPSEQPEHLGRLGNYEITGVVGVGGMGVVLKGVDASLDRVVAIKVMAPRLANNELARQRFAREAKAAAAVHHPNVIPIHSVTSGGKLPCFVMTYVRGESLQKRLNREGPLSLVEVLRIGSQIAAGLSAAHGQGLVHRDIKPENILMEEGVERVTITDFGLARAVDDNTVTQQGTIAGTPQYMSPEQARGEKLDQQTDLFSLGSVLYAMCAGRPPYQAESSYAVMRKIIDQSPTPLRQLAPATPEWLAQIIRKLMHREKENRVQTASEAQAMLEGCLNYIQQPNVLHLPQEVQNLHVEPTADVRYETIDEPKTSKKTRSSVVVLASALMLLLAGFAFTPIRGMLAGMFAEDPAFLSVGGGALQNSQGWSILSGSSCFENDQPAVMFGLHEMPDSNRELTYAIVFRHSATDQSQVASSATSGLTFDGEVARGTGGVTVNGIGFQSVLDLQVSNQVDKAEIRIGDTKYDLLQGNIFFIDLTDRSVPVRQMAVAPMEKLPDPTDLSGDTNLVLQFVKDLIGDLAAKNANVAEFLKACRDPKVATPQALFSAEPQDGMESEIPPRWSATSKSARIELMQLRMSESDLLARFKESHPDVLMVRKRIRLLENMIPEIPEDERYFPAASKQLNVLMELRFRESDLYHSGRSSTAEFRLLQEQIDELKDEIEKGRADLMLQKQLVGKWQVFACWLSGEHPDPSEGEMTFEFRGDKMILASKASGDEKATFRLTDAKPFPQIDYSSDGVLYRGIFELRGDILQIVASRNARPTTMRMAGGVPSRDTDMFIMKRARESVDVNGPAGNDNATQP